MNSSVTAEPRIMKLMIGRRQIPVSSFAQASSVYSQERDKSGLGGSKWPEGHIFERGALIARVSYNGRVWSPEPWTVDSKPIYDNRGM